MSNRHCLLIMRWSLHDPIIELIFIVGRFEVIKSESQKNHLTRIRLQTILNGM